MNEITIRTERTFQTKELNDAVKGLSKAFQNIENNRKDACLIMWRLENGKKYEKDGFKSLFEFAETIGIDKSTAHKMADAGRVYDSKVPAIAQFADKAGYTVAANVASMLKDNASAKKLEEAINNKSLNENMTVEKVKAWKADATAQSKPEKVLSKFEVDVKKANGDTVHYDSVELENVTEIDGLQKVGMVKRGDNANPCAVYIDSVTLETVVVQYAKVKKVVKPVTKSIKKMTKEELLAALAALEEEEEE